MTRAVSLLVVLALQGCLTCRVVDGASFTRRVPRGPTATEPRELVRAREHEDGSVTVWTTYSDGWSYLHRWLRAGDDGAPIPALVRVPSHDWPRGRRLTVAGDDAELRLEGRLLVRAHPGGAAVPIGEFPLEYVRGSREEALSGPEQAVEVARLVVLLPFAVALDAATLPLQGLLYPLYVGFRDAPP